jgi:hypothetical protein
MVDSRAVDEALAGARAALTAPAPTRQRVRARLDADGAFAGTRTGAPSAPSAPSASGASGASGASPHGGAAGLVRSLGVARSTVAVLVGLGFGAGYWLGTQHPQPGGATPFGGESVPAAPAAAPPPEPPRAPAPSVAPTEPSSAEDTLARVATDGRGGGAAAQLSAETSAQPRVPVGAEQRSARSPAPRASRKPGFSEELALLQRAERALRAGEAELALSFVSELERRYPESPFREERGAARVMAECALGRPGARDRAVTFLRDRPASVYSDRVHQLCSHENTDGFGEPGH